MQPMEKNVEKQLVVRTFEPDMNALKQTAKQLAHMQDTSLNLYGQAGEVLIVVTARAYAQAAATELTENVAEQFELALGPAAYGRGKGSLAYFTAGELIQSESTIAAADPATGALLAEEFSHTKRGPSVFDFGDGSYNDSRVVAKIKNAVYKYAEEGNAPQIAAARAAAAARFAATVAPPATFSETFPAILLSAFAPATATAGSVAASDFADSPGRDGNSAPRPLPKRDFVAMISSHSFLHR